MLLKPYSLRCYDSCSHACARALSHSSLLPVRVHSMQCWFTLSVLGHNLFFIQWLNKSLKIYFGAFCAERSASFSHCHSIFVREIMLSDNLIQSKPFMRSDVPTACGVYVIASTQQWHLLRFIDVQVYILQMQRMKSRMKREKHHLLIFSTGGAYLVTIEL